MSGVQAKFNFTGRETIHHDKVRLEIEPDEHAVRVTGSVDVSGLGLPRDARVIIELYREIYSEQQEVTLADLTQLDRRFKPHAAPTTLLCNVRVVSAETPGLILASAERVRPDASTELGGRSLLPIASGEIGELLWRLELADAETLPVLLVNKRLNDPDGVARDPKFQLLVFPTVLRDIGYWLARNLHAGEMEEGPLASWRDFFIGLGVDPTPMEDEGDQTAIEWVDAALERFMSRNSAVAKWDMLTPSGDE